MGSELSRGGALPALVGLCPDPAHTGEFYMPLDPHEGTICPECSEQLVVYVSTPWLIANGVGSGWLAGRGVAVGSNQYSEQRSNTAPTQGATAPSERESSPES